MMNGSTKSRYIRAIERKDESKQATSSVDAGTISDLEARSEHLEDAIHLIDDEECGAFPQTSLPALNTHRLDDFSDASLLPPFSTQPKWTRRRRLSTLRWILCGSRRRDSISHAKSSCGTCRNRRRPLRIVLKSLAIALMLLGLIETILLAIGLIESFFPSELDNVYSSWLSRRPSDAISHWPTDYLADVQPIQCHSHNDYWRPIPLESAIRAGCTGVEADVWLFPDRNTDELFVGHSKSSLTPQRTFRSLYIDPLVAILEGQNPNTTFHPLLDNPRNGVFDTKPEQTLVLLVDFKTDGQELWSYVSEQLEPLRQRQYLTHFNGSALVEGPVTVVATGNAPFNKVIENPLYRDIFFDAPLELLGVRSPKSSPSDDSQKSDITSWTTFDDLEEQKYLVAYAAEVAANLANSDKAINQGQGHSGAAPQNPAIYTPANSYYASVSFSSTIGWPLPFLTRSQKHKIRQQIHGAHVQGLQVRYWSTPAWPKGLKQYVWRVLVEEGVDYLNVDDLHEATHGDWGAPTKHQRWGLHGWSPWDRK